MGNVYNLQLNYQQTVSLIACYKCSLPIALTADQERNLRENHESFYCPLGHQQHFTGKSETERLREQLSAQIRSATEASARAYTAEQQLARHKRRAAAGTCPCCKRSFVALARHMKAKHPEFGAA